MELPIQLFFTRNIEHQRATLATSENEIMLPLPSPNTNFTIPIRYSEMILYESGTNDKDHILISG
ncbi:hypothetical protein MXB_4486 [Myxobolus squamalis]|nr:hypothetical protein MXB_4486 [Myxobolus squamalis]